MDGWIEDALQNHTIFYRAKHRPVVVPPPPAPVVDTHAHLSMLGSMDAKKELSKESCARAAKALARAWFWGVTWIICVADASEEAQDPRAFLDWLSRAEEAAHQEIERAQAAGLHPAFAHEPLRVSLAAGVHPYGAPVTNEAALERLRKLGRDPRCVALGEMGLDYHCDLDHELQKEAFGAQLALAQELQLPVELHVRDAKGDASYEAHRDALSLVAPVAPALKGIDLHCYTLGPQPLAPWVALGAKVAFGGAATFKRSEEVREAACACPQSQLITETDSPFMAPEPLRGQSSEPAMALVVANLLAACRSEILGEREGEVYAALWANARELFGAS